MLEEVLAQVPAVGGGAASVSRCPPPETAANPCSASIALGFAVKPRSASSAASRPLWHALPACSDLVIVPKLHFSPAASLAAIPSAWDVRVRVEAEQARAAGRGRERATRPRRVEAA